MIIIATFSLVATFIVDLILAEGRSQVSDPEQLMTESLTTTLGTKTPPTTAASGVPDAGGPEGFVLVLFWVLAALFAPFFLEPQANDFDTANPLAGPSLEHWFGTDALGRDVLSRVLVAARLTFALTFGAVIISLVLGVFIGVLPPPCSATVPARCCSS